MEKRKVYGQNDVWLLGALCAEAGVGCPPTAAHIPIRGVCADSRCVREGELFIAIKGFRQDATRCIGEAVSRGCAAVVCDRDAPPDETYPVPVLCVPDGRVAMAYLYDAWYHHPGRSLCLVGVTGTNGKTSVSAMIRHILRAAGKPCGIIGTVGGCLPDGTPLDIHSPDDTARMTTPDPAQLYAMLAAMADGERRHHGSESRGKPVVVMEVTSHALALGKVEPLHFDVAVFTNLSQDHLDLHGSMEAYAAAKYRLFDQTRLGVVNAADAYGRRLLLKETAVEEWLICHPTPSHMDIPCDRPCGRIYAEQVTLRGAEGISYRWSAPRARGRVVCPVPGSFTVENTLLAASVAMALGIRPAVIRSALADFPGVQGRMERVPLPKGTPYTVFIDFAHTPDALERLLSGARDLRVGKGRVVVVFGCGGDRDPGKRAVMGRIAAQLADRVILTSDNSRSEDPQDIIRAIASGIPPACAYEVIPHRAEAIRHAVLTAEAGDIILLAGKGHEAYEIDRQGIHPFCEREIAQNAAALRQEQPKK